MAKDTIYQDDEEMHVKPEYGCPRCGETFTDHLLWAAPGDGPLTDYQGEYVYCATCSTAYDPDTRRVLATDV